MLQPPAPRSRQRSWSSLAISSAVHTGLLVLAVLLSRQPAEESKGQTEDSSARNRQVDVVYLPPPPEAPPPEPPPPEAEPEPAPQPTPPTPAPRPAPIPRPFSPPPEREQRQPEADANAPPEAERVEGRGEPDAGGSAAPAPEAVTMESEARRIFGRKRTPTSPGVGPRAVRPMESYIPEDPAKCVPRPAEPRDPSAPVQFGVAEGRILRADTGRPLAGAHLQMLGTPYTAFTDDQGAYKFRFDMSLVDQCRTQYVRVEAKGYESRLLVLVVGVSVRSEDVRLEKRSWWR
ncbi:MAG TPA: carboxypeptidase-like regulatory domain-containing protein [Gemmatimonadales bacterium]|nr:carboxypeptidase-like regulatory domain-containing protein [Gemmatimonadales bacterium]